MDANKLQFVSSIWSRKHSCKKLRFVNIFDCLFDLVQTALMQRVEILKRVWFVKYHYANTPVQYTAIFHGCKNIHFQMKMFNIFLIFAQNIDCGYTLEPPNRTASVVRRF